MDYKVCTKCGIKKTVDNFEYRKDKNGYRSVCKECRNKQRREYYQLNREEINDKRRKNINPIEKSSIKKRREHYQKNKTEYIAKRKNRNNNPFIRLRNQLIRSINKAYERKGFVREDSYEEILGYPIEKVIESLLLTYKIKYKKEWDGIVEVNIDHIVPIWTARTKEEVKKLCKRGDLQLLTKEENHRKGGKMSCGIGKNGKTKYVYFNPNMFN